jgi:hypothetical protein
MYRRIAVVQKRVVPCTLRYALRTSDYAFTRLYAFSTSEYIWSSESYTSCSLDKRMPFSLGVVSGNTPQHLPDVSISHSPRSCLAKNIFWN